MNNIEKGKLYENVINTYINTLPQTQISYLWNDVPEQVLFNAGLITDYNKHRLKRKNKIIDPNNSLKDVGIDIIQIDNNENIIFVQCKNYTNALKVDDLSGFWMMMAQHNEKMGIVYHSVNKLSTNIKENMINDRIKFIHKSIPKTVINNTIKLYDYQEQIIKLYDDYYKQNNKSVLSMPCGTGKTLVSCYISRSYHIVIFVSPLKQFAEQNIDRYKEYDKDRAYLLVDSDGTRDVDTIKKFIKDNKKVMLSVTYKSCDIIAELMNVLLNPFIIIDEFHNLSSKNVYGLDNEKEYIGEYYEEAVEIDPLNKLINSDYKMLYMSATPRIYELEDNDDCDVEDILGKVVYKMDFKTAIENKYITDYNMYLPIMEDTSKTELDGLIVDIKKELKIAIDTELSQKCCYLYECIKQFGTLKCIIYFRSHLEITNFIECFNQINKYYVYDYNIDGITCNDSRKQRLDKIHKFKMSDTNSFLCAVNILDECIDIPECNAIYVTYNCHSKIKNVQRMSRAMRLSITNKNKKAKIMLWCDNMADMVTYMSSIKEIDLNYNEKVRYVKFNKGLIKEDRIETEKYVARYGKWTIGIQEYQNFSWNNMLVKVEAFIKEYNRRPVANSKNKEENIMRNWLSTQQQNYKNKIQIMKNKNIQDRWDIFINTHIEYFRSDINQWNYMLENITAFIKEHNKRPLISSKNQESMAYWLHTQQRNYKNKTQIMKSQIIYDKWTIFISTYIEYFRSDKDKWNITLNQIIAFIKTNNKLPSKHSKNIEERTIGKWLVSERQNYKNNVKSMKSQYIYDEFTAFINEHLVYFLSNEQIWYNTLNQIYKFIKNNERLPKKNLKNIDEKKFNKWINHQRQNFKNKREGMKNDKIRNSWIKFIEDHKEYFET